MTQESSNDPCDIMVDVFVICDETIPAMIERTGLTEDYFRDLIRWDENIGVKAYFFPKLLPAGEVVERLRTETIIQFRDPDDIDDVNEGWRDEHIISHGAIACSPEEYFDNWGHNSGFEFRLIERKIVTQTRETVISEKKT